MDMTQDIINVSMWSNFCESKRIYTFSSPSLTQTEIFYIRGLQIQLPSNFSV